MNLLKSPEILFYLFRSESRELEQEEQEKQEQENGKENGAQPRVLMRQRSSTPRVRKDNRLSYIDNEIKVILSS